MTTYNLHIHLPDGDADVSRETSELPPNTVSTKQYDGLVDMHRQELADREANHRIQRRKLRATIDELKCQIPSVPVRENLNYYVKKMRELTEANMLLKEQEVTLRQEIHALEDKVAGYELGMSKAQVDKECGEPKTFSELVDKVEEESEKGGKHLTKRGTKRKYRRQLSDKQVWTARAMHKRKCSAAEIAAVLGCGPNAAYRAARCRTYAHVPNQPDNFKPITIRAGHGVIKNGEKK
ncbi:MAG: hypothetical protein DRQ39_03485 [Gammaproteobacteria bacterium]|nr:MAG: hypothetical protein DRQ39_03485 [Gammaproteobacteria bacterium]